MLEGKAHYQTRGILKDWLYACTTVHYIGFDQDPVAFEQMLTINTSRAKTLKLPFHPQLPLIAAENGQQRPAFQVGFRPYWSWNWVTLYEGPAAILKHLPFVKVASCLAQSWWILIDILQSACVSICNNEDLPPWISSRLRNLFIDVRAVDDPNTTDMSLYRDIRDKLLQMHDSGLLTNLTTIRYAQPWTRDVAPTEVNFSLS